MFLRGLIRRFNTSVSVIRATRMPFYAVRAGKTPGIYTSWSECEEQIKGFKGAKYKKFDTEKEAQDFIDGPNPNIKAGSSADGSASDNGDGVPIYIHGCCHGNKGDMIGGIGVYFGKDDADNFSARIGGKQSTNRAEILAAARAIEKAKSKGIKHLIIHSENQFMINCASQWMEGWKKKGWKKSSGEEVTNREELEELDAASKDIKVTYIHSKNKNENNEAAKQLAKAGTKLPPVDGDKKALSGAKKRSHSDDDSDDDDDDDDDDDAPASKKKHDDLSDGVKVYTDGCCHNNGKDEAKAGIGVYWGPDNPNNLSERLTGRQTNNRAEIIAAKRAIEQAKTQGIKHLILHTDSQFLIDCATKWMEKWKRNGWKQSKGEDVANKDELEELEAASQGIKITYVHVDGHSGIPENEAADKLANAGARKSSD